MSKNKNADDPDRDVLDWVVVFYNGARGYVTHLDHMTYGAGQSILSTVREGKGLRLKDRTYRPGYIDWAEIMPQVDWENLGQKVTEP